MICSESNCNYEAERYRNIKKCPNCGGILIRQAKKWTPEYRLKLIKALAHISHHGPRGETIEMLMERIMFLCDMPDNFLEANKRNWEDAIKIADIDLTVEL
jgi:hypothetical protein